MRYHMIVNGCAKDCEKQIKELNGFSNKSGLKHEKGDTIIICEGKQNGDDKQKLAEMVLTKSVIFVIVDYYDPEIVLDFMEHTIKFQDLLLFGSNYSACELAVRLGMRLNGSSVTDCIGMEVQKEQILAEKMVYSNHMKGTFLLQQVPYCISVARGQEESLEHYEGGHEITEYDLKNTNGNKAFSVPVFEEAEHETGLEEAAFVVVAGRGVKNKEAARELEETAERMHASFGASRPVVMNAWTPMEKLVGVSGHLLKPDICITAGVSGAPALYAGIEKSKLIVAVNTNEKAPIIKKSDVAIIGDYKEVLEEMAKKIEREGPDE